MVLLCIYGCCALFILLRQSCFDVKGLSMLSVPAVLPGGQLTYVCHGRCRLPGY